MWTANNLGYDLKIAENGDFKLSSTGDLELISGRDCLLQDVRHRLEMSHGDVFGHEDFGSVLFQYLGQADTELNRALIKRSVVTALEREKRIYPKTIQVKLVKYTSEEIQVHISFIPLDKIHPLTLLWGITVNDPGELIA